MKRFIICCVLPPIMIWAIMLISIVVVVPHDVVDAAQPMGTQSAAPPSVPHSLKGRTECLACHGDSGFKPVPKSHAERTVDMCLRCHQGGE